MSQEIKQEPKKEAPKRKSPAKTVLKLKKNYHIVGIGQCKKGDVITPEIQKALKERNVPVSAVSE